MTRSTKNSISERERRNKQRTEVALQSFFKMMESGEFPATVAEIAMLSRASDAPSAKWSAGNQVLMVAQGTMDARGFRQWEEVGRSVKKGTKAIHISRPRNVTVTEMDEVTGEEGKKRILVGFTFQPVFRVEDTEGEPLPEYEPTQLPPLVEVAEAFGVSVKYAPPAGDWGGYYRDGTSEIVLCNHSQRTFFHELSHAAHYRLKDEKLRAVVGKEDKIRKEMVAEMAAAALGRMYGYEYAAESCDYLSCFAETNGDSKQTLRKIMQYTAEVRSVLELILNTSEEVEMEKWVA